MIDLYATVVTLFISFVVGWPFVAMLTMKPQTPAQDFVNAKNVDDAIRGAEILCQRHKVVIDAETETTISGCLGHGMYVLKKGKESRLVSRPQAENIIRANLESEVMVQAILELENMARQTEPLAVQRWDTQSA